MQRKQFWKQKIYFSMPFFFKSVWHISWGVPRKGTKLGQEESTVQVNQMTLSTNDLKLHMTQQYKGWWYIMKKSSKLTAPSRKQVNCLGTQVGKASIYWFSTVVHSHQHWTNMVRRSMQLRATARYNRSTQKQRLKGKAKTSWYP